MDENKEFRNCYSEDCCDCPRFEQCQEEDYDDDEPNDWILEQQEMEDFAMDGDFDNMPPGGYEDDFGGYDW